LSAHGCAPLNSARWRALRAVSRGCDLSGGARRRRDLLFSPQATLVHAIPYSTHLKLVLTGRHDDGSASPLQMGAGAAAAVVVVRQPLRRRNARGNFACRSEGNEALMHTPGPSTGRRPRGHSAALVAQAVLHQQRWVQWLQDAMRPVATYDSRSSAAAPGAARAAHSGAQGISPACVVALAVAQDRSTCRKYAFRVKCCVCGGGQRPPGGRAPSCVTVATPTARAAAAQHRDPPNLCTLKK
jgi:hypothetical protein